jgi:hypothetical protein
MRKEKNSPSNLPTCLPSSPHFSASPRLRMRYNSFPDNDLHCHMWIIWRHPSVLAIERPSAASRQNQDFLSPGQSPGRPGCRVRFPYFAHGCAGQPRWARRTVRPRRCSIQPRNTGSPKGRPVRPRCRRFPQAGLRPESRMASPQDAKDARKSKAETRPPLAISASWRET